eukprot:GGOE01041119.1.p2 GENE.GGOE01041119.1~~GGOE01041119.1.p2  ORF type:complete len:232 (+),score=53.37 GGOE01041119.1:25-696(+)
MDEGDGATRSEPRFGPGALDGIEALIAAGSASRMSTRHGSPSARSIPSPDTLGEGCHTPGHAKKQAAPPSLPPQTPQPQEGHPPHPALRVVALGLTLACAFIVWQLANILYPLPAGHAHQEAIATRIKALKADPDPDPFLLPMLRLKASRLGNWQDSRVRIRAIGLSIAFFGCLWGVLLAVTDRCPSLLACGLLLAAATAMGNWASTSTFSVSALLPHHLEGW